jgi:GNAT superfamily N-acetyltransferase
MTCDTLGVARRARNKKMDSELQIRQATTQDAEVVSEILREAAQWQEHAGMPLWREEHIGVAHILDDVRAGIFFLAEYPGESAGTMKFQLEDPLFWPEACEGEAAYVHRLAVRRRYAGTGVSTTLLRWAVERTRALGRPYLRLDCAAARLKLRAIYERFGFLHHSYGQIGAYYVARYEYDVTRSRE